MTRNEIFKEWVKRLRSGRYIQGTEYLRKDDKYCCLGVLCELAVEAGIVTNVTLEDSPKRLFAYNGCTEYVPMEVADWAGLTWGDVAALINKNDVQRWSFPEIADYIESRCSTE